ncbi:MAG TPA: TRZ/ATZ family hydrolase [Steroidobacteraceae bacterium]|jgi:5-methylthioadenosine/S-adenosylhomocysteine deaminase
MRPIDTLITARWIIPVEPFGQLLEEHAIAVHQGRILAVEPVARALEHFSAVQRIDRPTHVVFPGLINTHTHAAMTLLRGAAEGLPFEGWLREQIWPLEQRWIDAEYVRDGTELAIADMLTSGTTCFADMHLFPEIVAQTASALRIRSCIGLPVIDAPTVWAGSADEYLEKGLRLHDEYRDDPLITTALAPYAPWAASDDTLSRVRRAADELELPMTMHVNETRNEVIVQGERSMARLERLGLLSPLLTAVHMVHCDESDMQRAVQGGIHIAHCPQSNLKLGNGICPVPTLLGHGLNMTLGTDGAASNNDLNMLDEMRTAALLAQGAADAGARIGAHDWLQIATLNGARALGLADVIGSLIPGKWADLCCVDLARAHTQPVYDPLAQLIYAASREQVTDVWVAGRQLVSEGQLTHMDVEDLMQRAQRWQQRIGGVRS